MISNTKTNNKHTKPQHVFDNHLNHFHTFGHVFTATKKEINTG